MMDHPLIILSFATLLVVLGFAVWQLRSVRHSQAKRGEVPGETTMTRHTPAERPVRDAADERPLWGGRRS